MENPLIRQAFGKGCVGGLLLAGLFLAISGGTYFILVKAGLTFNVVLVVSILSGPIVGTFGTLSVLYIRSRQNISQSSLHENETTPRN